MTENTNGTPEAEGGAEQEPNQVDRTREDEPAAEEELHAENAAEATGEDTAPEPHEVEEDFPQPEPPSSADVSPVEPPPPHGAVRDDAFAEASTGAENTMSGGIDEELTPLPPEEVTTASFIKWGAVAAGALTILYWMFRKKK